MPDVNTVRPSSSCSLPSPAPGGDPARPLLGQVALVTGASSGLGRRFALALAEAGADVAIVARRADRLEEVKTEVETLGVRCSSVVLDILDDTHFEPALDEVEAALGPVRILVNNAGIPDAQYATRISPELADRVIGTNLRGPFLLASAVARRLIKAKTGGRIVNLSSMAAYHYSGNGAALYSITKAAVDRMTETLAVEWAKFNINVNAIAPGTFISEMTAGMLERVGDLTEQFPRKRYGEAHHLDSTLLYLVSPASDHVTGTIVKVDDGQFVR